MSAYALQRMSCGPASSSKSWHTTSPQPRSRRSKHITRCWSVRDPEADASDVSQKHSAWLKRARWCSYGTLCSFATPSVANSWPWEKQSPLPIPLPSSNFPISLPYGVDYLLGHPFVTIGLAAGLYVVVPRLWRLLVRVVLLPVLAIAAVGFALQHPAASLSFGTKALGCESRHCCQAQNS